MKHSIAVSALIAVASSQRNNLNLLSIRYPDEEILAPEYRPEPEFFPIIEDDPRYSDVRPVPEYFPITPGDRRVPEGAIGICWEENMTYADSGNDGCEWYGIGTNYLTCGNYDTEDFNAR